MSFKRIFVLLLTTFIGFSAFAQQLAREFSTTQPFDSLYFEIGSDSKIYVNATVNDDSIPLRFMFDTGAVDNIINTRSEHALRTISDKATEALNNRTTTGIVTNKATPYNNNITIGETTFKDVRFILSPTAENLDGIIGWNTMTGVDFLIDWDRQMIYLYPAGGCELQESCKWTSLEFVDGLPTIDIAYIFTGKDHRARVWLDSGSDRCIDFTTSYINTNALKGKQKPWGISTIASLEGDAGKIEEVICASVTIDEYTLYQVPVGLNLTNAGAAANPNWDGVLGNNMLQRFNQFWSFAKKRLYLVPNRRMYAAPYRTADGLLKNKVTLK